MLTVFGTLFFMAISPIETERISLITLMGLVTDFAIVVVEACKLSCTGRNHYEQPPTSPREKSRAPCLTQR